MSDVMNCRRCGKREDETPADDMQEHCDHDYAPRSFDYPSAWAAFWLQHKGAHSVLRCPGSYCPGGCGANAKDDMAAIQDARRGRGLTDVQQSRIEYLLRELHRKVAHAKLCEQEAR